MDNHRSGKERTAKLEKELSAKTHELEIEAALEKVRTVAMRMNKPSDLPDVCKTLYKQFLLLGFSEMRNAMVNIHNDADKSFINYDYSDEIGKSTNHLTYNIHPLVEKQIKKIRSANNAFSETYFSGEDLVEWRKFRKRIGEKNDPRLRKTKGLYYYFYSIGTGSIGISTFGPISKEKKVLLKRFRNVFNLSYQRYIDITKAEAQAREAQIEAALEKVRSRSLAMHKSDELQQVVAVAFERLRELNISMDAANIDIFSESTRDADLWIASPGQEYASCFHLPYVDYLIPSSIFNAKENGDDFFAKTFSFKEKNKYFNYLFAHSDFKHLPESRKNIMLAAAAYTVSFAFTKSAAISIHNYSDKSFSDEENNILKRFANVFEQAYTRFLDLQKAETQAREAKIEAALEKIRSRSLAMHKSDELWEVVAVVFEKLQELNFSIDGAAFISTFIEGSKDSNVWLADDHGQVYPSSMKLPYYDTPAINDIWSAKESGLDFFSKTYSFEEKNRWLNYVFENTDFKILSDELKNWILEQPCLTHSFALGQNSMIGIHFHHQKTLSETEADILKRFSKVFDQAYIRFLDLQKAEVQAREAQIQLALERVRARTMAMQKSDELPETAAILFEQFKSLGQELMQMTIGIMNEADGVIEFSVTDWSGSGAGVNRAFNLSIEEPSLIKKLYAGWKENKRSIVVDLTGKELENWISYRNKMSGVTVNSADTSGRRVITGAFFSKGHLSVSTPVLPASESIQLLERFAQVFDLTYTRFLDLQKAEAQARESQIQLALERVRARTMAMQKSDELAEAARVLYEEFRTLNINTFLCGYCFYKEEQDKQTIWVTFPDGTIIPDFIDFPITGDHILNKRYEDWKEKKPLHVLEIQGEENKEHHRFLASKVSDQAANEIFAQIPDRIIVYGANFSTGYLFIIATELLTGEEEDVIIRFAKVFELTYTRFNDLKQAEAQARESQIQLALERVRARTMAMQKSDELMEASNLLLQQVQSLGIPVWACGYNIWEPGEKVCTAWMSVLGAIQPSFRLPLTEHRTFIHMYESRLKAEASYVEEVSGEELADHYRYMFSLPDFREIATKQLQGSSFPLPQSQAHHVFNFKHGNLIFLSAEAIPEALDIFKRFTAVFEQTYTRFLDLQKAETQAREAKIEAALENVRSRSLAMHHSNELKEVVKKVFEKMKELGFFQNNSVMIVLPKNGFKDVLHWTFNEHFETMEYNIPAFNHSVSTDSYKAWERGEKTCEIKLNKEEKDDFLYQIFTYTDYSKVPDEFKKHLYSTEAYNSFVVFENHCGLLVDTFTSVNYSEDQKDVVKRFAKVFEQAYIRFLDLQKAEAQARQAQIEASLERVRASAMAMHRSDELSNVLAILFEQFDVLKIQPVDVHLDLFDLEKNTFSYRATGKEGKRVIAEQIVDLGSRPEWQALLQKWKKGKPNTVDFSYYPKEVIRELMAFFPDIWAAMPEDAIMSPEDFPDGIFDALGFCKFGYIGFHHHRKATEEEQKILIRFANEFERLYQRFLDLQKAEAQARESQIELGLERVRARAMAMQKSDELSELVDTVFKELTKLDFALTWCIINIIDEPSLSNMVWAANPDIDKAPDSYHMKFEDYPFHHAMMKGWKERRTKYVYVLEGAEKKIYDKYLFNETEFRKVPEAAQAASSAMEKYVVSFSFSNFGGLQTVGDVPLSDANLDILSRFGKVFDLTYTRFNDLKQAEEQARESQIQLALERVRARTMAMQKSDELADAASVLFKQVNELGIKTWSTGFEIWNTDGVSYTSWMTDPTGRFLPPIKIPLYNFWLFKQVNNAKKRGEEFLEIKLDNEQTTEGYEYLASLPATKGIFDAGVVTGIEFPKSQVDNYVFFSQGNLLFITYEPCPEAWDIFKRFGKVFEQTYTRFLDLEKAEAQARESQIEAALERVRSRSMGMQKSEELREVIQVIYEQFVQLNMRIDGAGFAMDYMESDDFNFWLADSTSAFPYKVHIPYFDHPQFNRYKEAREKGLDFYTSSLTSEERNRFFDHASKYVPIPQELIEAVNGAPGYETSHVVLKNVILYILNFSGLPFSDAENATLMRFGKVFEQTYTRFNDLKQAEAQAREAKIEAGLEKVRSRTMAMQHSNELQGTALLLFQQILALGVSQLGCGFNIWDEDRRAFTSWMGGGLGENTLVPAFKVPSSDDIFLHIREAAEKGESLFVSEQTGEALETHYKYMFSLPIWKDLMAGFTPPTFQVLHCAYFSQGFLMFISREPVPHAHDIFKRFAKVFEQTYTRFLDLQKAEAQAREAKIETALEKVRSRTMAMQRSDELAEVATVLFQQVKALGVPQWTCGFSIFEIDDNEFTWYPGSAEGDILLPVKIPLTEHPVFISFNESRKRGDELYVYEKTGEMQADHYLYMLSLPVVGEGLQNMLDSGIQFPSFQIDHLANFSHGNLVFITYKPFPEMHDVFRRFAKVFDQTYTRFLDLQKAEAQVREAQIEAALERVRSRSMGMQKSEELKEVIQVVYEQFVHLNMNVEHTGFVMDYKTRDDYDIWIADQLGVPSHVTIPYFDSVYYNRFNEAKKKGEDFFATNLDFEEKNRFYKKIIEYVPGLPEESKEFLFSIPGLAGSTVMLDNVCLYIENFSGTPYSDEENNTLMRFGKVFQQTYTRFLDLQKAEAQAREAIKRASVDRIRAEIASMRTTNDLERITPLIWNELTTLGVPFIRCGVFIMDEEKQLVETHLSTPDGHAIASFTSTFSGTQLLTEILPYWQRKEVYKAHWDEAMFLEQARSLVQQGSITSGEKYLTENRPTDLYLHFLPFLQGMLYAGNTSPLSDDALQLMQNLGDAFSTAYARYEDFNKLEVAKEQIEKTLVDLKQAQQQLVQSEKMASLGELTAGIAHEIQNPLNFVNNFSDVNKELLEELKEEADKGNIAEIKAIANDVINNEEKINHHGKRADAIVKNMLQHSRSSGATKELTDINKLADEYLRLSYHGLRAKDKSFNADFKTELDEGVGKINVIPQDIGRVLLNLFNNAFYATNEKTKRHVEGYEPTISVSTKKINGKVEIIVKDNGNGIPQKIVDKIFQPFFTTKPTGQGTGLGLSLSYDIIKAHGGEIKVETKEGEGSEFEIQLPLT